jgi:hybrid cluster-associated redox disulfide protein
LGLSPSTATDQYTKELVIMGINISESATVKELLDQHPYLLHTFLDLGLMCVGCAADAFHNLDDVAKEYNLDKKEVIARLENVIDDITARKTNR